MEEATQTKIGIGPEGRAGGLVQLILICIIGWYLFVYALPGEFLALKLLPGSLIYLIALGNLSIIGDNWPLAPPGGGWHPGQSRLVPGIGMTVIWAVLTVVILVIMMQACPKWPMGPLYLWFGVIGFWATLLYSTTWNAWPLKGRFHPWVTAGISLVGILALSTLIWVTLTNLDGTPFADTPLNQHGPLNVQWLTGYLVWSIAWFFMLNPIFVSQGMLFRNQSPPVAALGQTVVAHILSWICWQGSLALGISPTFSFGAVASSIIFWSLVYSWHLQFWGITRFTGAKRGWLAMLVVVILTVIWILILTPILQPTAAILQEQKLPMDVNLLIIYFNLCIVGPALIIHNAFWLRWPLTLPTPPGTPPPDQAAD
jgi:hypothetical protein